MPTDYQKKKKEGYKWICVFIKNDVAEKMNEYAFTHNIKTREVIEKALSELLSH